MDMDQDSEEEKELYLNLALHLASDFFLKHPDKDVRLLVACCLADIFRIYAPEAPYTSPDKLKVHVKILLGRTKQNSVKLHPSPPQLAQEINWFVFSLTTFFFNFYFWIEIFAIFACRIDTHT